MQENLNNIQLLTHANDKVGWVTKLVAKSLFEKIRDLRGGAFRVIWSGQTVVYGDKNADTIIDIEIHDESFFYALATRGSVGAGEAYMDGAWSTPDLVGALRLILMNYHILESMEGGIAALSRPLLGAYHRVRKNTVSGSKKNISAHYDLSNEFFELMLDETMMYSSGMYATPETTLYEASVAKLDAICRKLQLCADDHVLEIGTGWGGFAVHAAKHYGARVTTTTISKEQYRFAKERVEREGLEDRITLLLKDYRELEGTYDKLVSIEMIEAVGHHFYETFFEVCQARLKPDGAALIQAITIADHVFEAARDSVDFIKRYIFPGSCIPSVTALCQAASKASDLKLFHLEDIGEDYARTLLDWRERFFDRLDDVKALGFDERFIRMWDFYLCYCAAGFQRRHISDVHLLMTRPDCRLTTPG